MKENKNKCNLCSMIKLLLFSYLSRPCQVPVYFIVDEDGTQGSVLQEKIDSLFSRPSRNTDNLYRYSPVVIQTIYTGNPPPSEIQTYTSTQIQKYRPSVKYSPVKIQIIYL